MLIDQKPETAAKVGASFLGQTVVIQSSNAAFQDGFMVVFAIFVLALVPTWFMWRART